MNCKTVQSQLSAYLDRELSGNEMLAMRQHMGECRACREEEEALRSLKQLLAVSRTPEPPADLADRLCAAVLAKDRRDVRKDSRVVLRTSFLTFAGVAACSMAFTFVLVNNAHPAGPTNSGVSVTDATKARDMAFYIQRDQVYTASLDATSGAPMISSLPDVHP